MSIEVTNISKFYGNQKALDAISFSVSSGEIAGFIGPNGAGKSTMMRIITGYLSPDAGNVRVNGYDIFDNSLEVRKQIGYLPENNPLYLNMYVKEYLRFTAGLYKLGRNTNNKVSDIIEKTGLTLEQNKKIGALSKGYRQRVGLAQALIHDPKVLILDEPTSGLDPNQILEIRNLIAETGKDITIMLSTHIMQEVEAICDRIIIINRGKIVADDKSADIYKKITDEGQVIFVEFNHEFTEEELSAITGVNKVVKIDTHSWLLQGTTDNDIRNDIFNFAVNNNAGVLSLQKKTKSLEEVFQELTK